VELTTISNSQVWRNVKLRNLAAARNCKMTWRGIRFLAGFNSLVGRRYFTDARPVVHLELAENEPQLGINAIGQYDE
jgi:hypothetical protein